jgi:hypothetical protein
MGKATVTDRKRLLDASGLEKNIEISEKMN